MYTQKVVFSKLGSVYAKKTSQFCLPEHSEQKGDSQYNTHWALLSPHTPFSTYPVLKSKVNVFHPATGSAVGGNVQG